MKLHAYATKENFLIKVNNNLSKKCQYRPIYIYAVTTIYKQNVSTCNERYFLLYKVYDEHLLSYKYYDGGCVVVVCMCSTTRRAQQISV